jgi:hypothetical protein
LTIVGSNVLDVKDSNLARIDIGNVSRLSIKIPGQFIQVSVVLLMTVWVGCYTVEHDTGRMEIWCVHNVVVRWDIHGAVNVVGSER